MATTRKNKSRTPNNPAPPSNLGPNSNYVTPAPGSEQAGRHSQESNFVPPSTSSGNINKQGASRSIIRTRRQMQLQQNLQESFDPPSSSLSMQKENQDRDRHDNLSSSRSSRGPAHPVSASSISGPPGSMQRPDPWNDSAYGGGRQGGQDQRYGHRSYPPPGHMEQHSRYPNSSGMNPSPNQEYYGHEQPRDMLPIAGSLSKELDLAAKEDDLDLGGGFSDTGPGKKTPGSNSSKKQSQSVPEGKGPSNENDSNDFRRRESQDQNRASNPVDNRHPPHYQGYQGNQNYPHYSHDKGAPHGGYGGGAYNLNYPPPVPGGSGGHGYYRSHQYHNSGHGNYPPDQQTPQSTYHPGSYPGGNNQGYPQPFSPHGSTQKQHGPWSPDRNRPSYGNENFPEPPEISRGNLHDNVNHSSSNSGARKKLDSPPTNKRQVRDRRPEGAWLDRIEGSDNRTPEKIGGFKNDFLNIGQSPFRSPLPSDKDQTDRSTPSSKRYKRSPLLTDTPFSLDTPGGVNYDSQANLNWSPMDPNFFDDPPPVSRFDQDPSIHFEAFDNTPANPNSSYRRRPGSPTGHSDRNHPPRSPFSNFVSNKLSPLNKSTPLQTSPLDKKQHSSHDRNRPNLYPSKHGGDYDKRGNPMDMLYGMDRHMGGYNNSPPDMRINSPNYFPSNSSRERFRPNNQGPIRLQIGNIGAKQAETRKGFDGINRAVSGPPMNPRNGGPPRSSPPPSFPFGPPEPSSSRRPMIPERPGGHDAYGTPLTNISNRPPNRTPPHYDGYHGGPGMMPGSAPRYYVMPPMPGTTPNKPGAGKENDGSGEKRSPCNCKRSKCLKLYCECFAAERYCVGCNCLDCNNTPAFESIRAEAIKATRAKNPNAFKPRFSSKFRVGTISSSPGGNGHNMGCRCKKSACLKKYCECFENGVLCGDKCKCVNCQNFVGSQALIDRRRKIKDHRGAEFAMRTADQAWKSRGSEKKNANDLPRNPRMSLHHSSGGRGNVGMSPSPMHHPPAHTPGSAHSNNSFLPPHMMQRPGYGNPPIPYGKSPMDRVSKDRRPIQYARSPIKSTPRAPASRLGFNPLSKKKGKKPEPALAIFGPRNPKQTKSTALGVFSYLSNDGLFNASLVSKLWSNFCLDEELWKL